MPRQVSHPDQLQVGANQVLMRLLTKKMDALTHTGNSATMKYVQSVL